MLVRGFGRELLISLKMVSSTPIRSIVKAPKDIKRFEYIDALRGLAVCLVIACHTYQVAMPVYHTSLAFLASLGARGVQLFFLISAFTLCYSKTKRDSLGETSNKSFYIRRYFRIAPMYYLGIIYFIFQGSLGSTFWIDETLGVTVWNVLANLFFINSISPYWVDSIVPGGWSISVEFLFYFMFPFIFSRVKSLVSSLNLLLICILFQTLITTIFKIYPLVDGQQLWGDFLFHYLPNQLPIFCLGIIAFQLILKTDYRFKNIHKLLLLSTVIVVVIFWKYVTLHHFVISIGFLILMLLLSKGKLKFIVNRLSTYLGKVSYSAYLVHFAVLFFIDRFGWISLFETEDYLKSLLNFGIIFVSTLIVTIGISTITYKYIEKPLMKLGQKIIA